MFNHKIEELGKKVKVTFTPSITGKEIVLLLDILGPFTKFYTATTQMKDFIGNIITTDNGICSIKGVYQGREQVVRNVKLLYNNAKNGDRVMVTEHLNLEGKFEFLATKHRILQGDLNFINCGWKDGNKVHYYRIDIYTGDYKLLVSGE